MANLKDRRVKMFRCHLDPMINGKSQNAFDANDVRFAGWTFELTPVGVFVTGKQVMPGGKEILPMEHLVPFANIQSIQFFPEVKPNAAPKPAKGNQEATE